MTGSPARSGRERRGRAVRREGMEETPSGLRRRVSAGEGGKSVVQFHACGYDPVNVFVK